MPWAGSINLNLVSRLRSGTPTVEQRECHAVATTRCARLSEGFVFGAGCRGARVAICLALGQQVRLAAGSFLIDSGVRRTGHGPREQKPKLGLRVVLDTDGARTNDLGRDLSSPAAHLRSRPTWSARLHLARLGAV